MLQTGTPRCRPRRSVGTVLLLLAMSVGTASAAPSDTEPEWEWFEGTVEEFYVLPDPLPAGDPGDLIRVQAVSSNATSTTVRIMYHSRDARDRDRAVTGMLTYPNAPAPAAGWPVVSWANGTVGMASHCAPSRAGRAVSTLGIQGVGVQTDYIGLGPVGEIHPYLSRPSEGHSVIDAVRAARNLPASGAGTKWVTIGGSQGGHGAESAHELGEHHAPELDLRGAVSLAPAAMFGRTYGGIDRFVTRVVGAMALYGGATEYPEIDPNDYVGPEGAAAASVMQTGCLGEIIPAVLGVPFEKFYVHDPIRTEPARSIAMANDVGRAKVDAPLFLVQGTADTTVVPARTRDLFARLCTHGQVTRYLEVAGADHGNVLSRALTEIQAWLAARLAGEPAASSCPAPTGPPTVVPGLGRVVEGDHGKTTLEVPVTLSAPSAQPVTVRWASIAVPPLARDQARAGPDYKSGSGAITFAPGQTNANAALRVRGDTTAERDELIIVSFQSPTNARIGGFWGLGAGTIIDDDV